jgi:pSer/pThr/pTyr-binding forkhead associated (FHA) protein
MDSFLRACGASGPLQLHLEGPGTSAGECLSFETPYVVIGSAPESDLVLGHREVSPRHAYLQLIDGHLFCVDLGSQSGTALGGQSHRAGWVEPDQTIRIGPYRIRPVVETCPAGSPGFDAPAAGELPPLTLDLSHRGFKSSECSITEGLSLVGSNDCQVRLLDPGVANFHCGLIYTRLGVWVVDLLGKGGIEVNGDLVHHALLHQGDELSVGRSTIRLRHALELESEEAAWSQQAMAAEIAQPLGFLGIDHPSGHFEEPQAYPSWAPAGSDLEPETEPELEPDPEPDPEPEQESRPSPPPSESFYSASRKRRFDEAELERSSAQERRGSCRYPVSNVDALLSWWEPVAHRAVIDSEPKDDPGLSPTEETIYSRMMARWPGSHNGTPASRAAAELARDPLPAVEETMKSCVSSARLVDISQTGMLVLSEKVPPADQQLWLRLENPLITEWVEVVMKGATHANQGGHSVRLAFREACPYDFFKAVVYQNPGT